jgi:alkaline phosphatase D
MMIAFLRRCLTSNHLHFPLIRYAYLPHYCQKATSGEGNIDRAKTLRFISSYDDNRLKKIPKRIIFGSCSSHQCDLSYWDRIVEQTPDLVILMGDNIYAPIGKASQSETGKAEDSIFRSTLSEAYKIYGSNPSFMRAIISKIPILATLDDNDYNFRLYRGAKSDNSMTSESIHDGLEASKQDFLRFFQVRPTDLRWNDGRGVYTSYDYRLYESGNVSVNCSTENCDSCNNGITAMDGNVIWRLQLIMLDVRRHKTPFVLMDQYNSMNSSCTGPYIPSRDKTHSLLGSRQWTWLEEQIRKITPMNNDVPSLRIVVSPIQFLSDGRHGWDCWNLFPHERERLLSLLSLPLRSDATLSVKSQSPQSIPTIVLSGDRHVAGFYQYEFDHNDNNDSRKSRIAEVTSSSLTHSVPEGLLENEVDSRRIGKFIYGNNFGVLQLDHAAVVDTDKCCTVSIHCATTGTSLFDTRLDFSMVA